jgi:high-affinity iron transporter
VIGQLIIAFREGFEAILLVSILITYLRKTRRESFIKDAYYGVVLAITVGAVISLLVVKFYRGFENKELFEGITALLAAAVLTSMITGWEQKVHH